MNEPNPTPAGTAPQIDPARLQRFMQQLRDDQNLVVGAIAGAGAAVVGAVVWAAVTAATNYQIGWMAVGVGFLVGLAVRTAGKGVDPVFGVVGAALALIGCALGNLLTIVAAIAHQQDMDYFDVLSQLTPSITIDLMQATFHPMDLLFYGFAIYVGYRYAIRTVSDAELAKLS